MSEKYWSRPRFQVGRKKKFKTPRELWEAACLYFDWVIDNPLLEERAFSYLGDVTYANVKKTRAMSIERMCSFIGLDYSNYTRYRKDEDYASTCETIDTIIRQQKFEGAAAGLLNPVIIARDLGLRDSMDHTSNGETIKGGVTSLTIDKAEVLASDLQSILDMV